METSSNSKSQISITNIKDGSGGNYLSNEIFYRVAILRNHLGLNNTLKSGHLHVPILAVNDLAQAQTNTFNVKTIIQDAIQGL